MILREVTFAHKIILLFFVKTEARISGLSITCHWEAAKKKEKWLQPEWFNKSIAEAISNRQKAYNISKLRPSPETKVAHIKECRNVDKLIRRAKLNEEDRVAVAAKDNPKAFFAHVNSRKPVKNTIGPLKDRTGSIISSDEGMANILNEYLFRQNTYLQNKKHTLTCQGGTGCYRFNYQPGS